MMDLTQLKKIPNPSDLELKRLSNEAIHYLQSTDWMVIRQLETKKDVPSDVLKKRALARTQVIEVVNG